MPQDGAYLLLRHLRFMERVSDRFSGSALVTMLSIHSTLIHYASILSASSPQFLNSLRLNSQHFQPTTPQSTAPSFTALPIHSASTPQRLRFTNLPPVPSRPVSPPPAPAYIPCPAYRLSLPHSPPGTLPVLSGPAASAKAAAGASCHSR